jgi:TetR/AcrR family transcriptional regulator, repressor for neighboring sulfatase
VSQVSRRSSSPDEDNSKPAKTQKPAHSAKPQVRFTREETTARILDAAEDLFSHNNPSTVTVRDIASRAGVTHALVHQYVGTKADVLNAVIVRDAPDRKRMVLDAPDVRTVMPLLFEDLLNRRIHTQSVIRSSMDGVEYASLKERTEVGRALLDLASASRASGATRPPAPDAMDPRIALVAAVAMAYGWVAMESWLVHIWELESEDPAEIRQQLAEVLTYITDLALPPDSHPPTEQD